MQLMQSQKTEALGRLTGGIAHDFNNSLAAITGWVRLAAEDLPDPDHPSQESLQQALKATRYAEVADEIATLRAELLNRMTLGDKVIDHERIHGLGEHPTEVVAVY